MAAQSRSAGRSHAGLPGERISGAHHGRAQRTQCGFRDHLRLSGSGVGGTYWGAGELLISSVSMVIDISSPAMAGTPFTPKSLRLIFVVADAPMCKFPFGSLTGAVGPSTSSATSPI